MDTQVRFKADSTTVIEHTTRVAKASLEHGRRAVRSLESREL